MPSIQTIIDQTKKWITDVVVGCNFCPFAAREVKQNSIYYQVETAIDLSSCLQAFMQECVRLDNNSDIETSLLIFSNAFIKFDDYLEVVSLAEKLIEQNSYEGVYQVASFHPLYQFADTAGNDAANYTNRSPYPMLHLLREESIEKALERFPDPEQISERNILFTRTRGELYMKMLRDSCF